MDAPAQAGPDALAARRALAARALPVALALTCGAVLWLVALRSGGWDWYLSEIHAHLLYSAIVRFHEFPYFSYFLNQGSYLVQDPQFPGLSVITPLVLAFGPESGLRFAAFLFGAAGFWFAFTWLGRHVSSGAAAFGALSWTLSLGILWRIAVGNDIFLWMLCAPLLLLLLEELFREPSPRAAVALGLATGACVIGPTFHAIVYLIAPAGLVWLLILGVHAAVTGALRARHAAMLGVALLLAVAVAAPRLFAWAALSMRRTIEVDGTMALLPALESLLSPVKAASGVVPIVGTTIAGGIPMPAYGIWESAVGLPHLATVLVLASLASAAVRRSRAAALAVALVALGLLLTSSATVWDAVRGVAPFLRVSRRYLILSSFGLSVLAAFGFAEVERRVGRWSSAWLAVAVAAVLGSTAAWISLATSSQLLAPSHRPLTSHPEVAPAAIPLVVRFQSVEALAEGHVLASPFHSVGNPCGGIIIGGVLCSDYLQRVQASPLWRFEPVAVVVEARAPVEVSHTAIRTGPIRAGEAVALNLRARPLLGYEIEPASGPVRLVGEDELLTILNPGPVDLPGVRVVARSPVPGWLWLPWGGLITAALAWLALPALRGRWSSARRSG